MTSLPLRTLLLGLAVSALTGFAVSAQKISLNVDDYQHAFEGGGSSIPLYLFNHFTLPPAGQQEALDLIVRDLNLRYLQDYPEFRPDDPTKADYWSRRAEYYRSAQAIDSTVQIVLVGNKFPADLMTTVDVNGTATRALDTDRDSIYWEVARWYFDILTYYKERGVDTDVLNVVNEPDFDKQYYYGHDGANKFAVAQLFTECLDALGSLIDSAALNPLGIEMPLIMGPSTIGPGGARDYVATFKADYPEAWANIDILGYHQYTGGTSTNLLFLEDAAEGRPLHMNEMHTNRGDDLAALSQLTVNHRGVLSLAQTFGAAVRRGTNAWYYFLNVFPGEQKNPGLLRIDQGFERPIPYKHYYAYKQLTSAQPAGSRVITRDLASIRREAEVLAFRPEGVDTAYVHFANFTGTPRRITTECLDDRGDAYRVSGYTQVVTDGSRDEVEVGPGTFPQASDSLAFAFVAPPYSLSTVTVAFRAFSGLSPKPAAHALLTAVQVGQALHVRFAGSQNLSRVQLFDAAGRLAHAQRVDAAHVELDVRDLPAGAYFLVSELTDGSVVRAPCTVTR